MRSRMMQMQVRAFAGLLVVLLAWDAYAYQGEHRMRVGHGVWRAVNSVHGLGPGRNWSSPRPSRNN